MGCCPSSLENDSSSPSEELLRENASLRRRLANVERTASCEELQRRFECKICFDATVSVVFLPCGHCMTCAECGLRFSHCPLCVSSIERLTHVTFP